jgi:hypothetical protein
MRLVGHSLGNRRRSEERRGPWAVRVLFSSLPCSPLASPPARLSLSPPCSVSHLPLPQLSSPICLVGGSPFLPDSCHHLYPLTLCSKPPAFFPPPWPTFGLPIFYMEQITLSPASFSYPYNAMVALKFSISSHLGLYTEEVKREFRS